MTMRILQILHDRERGGVQTLAAMIEDGLAAHGAVFETVYLFPRPGLSTREKLRCTIAMARRILAGGFDALVAYQATASILVGAVGWLQGCRLRIVHQTCTPGETAWPVRLLDKLVGMFGLYTVNIANSASTLAEFDAYSARYRRAMTLIEHGLDPPAPKHGREETRRRFNLPQTCPILLNVGRLVAQKNQQVLIRALARVPQAHLAMAGAGVNERDYRALAATLGVADRVHFLGAVAPGEVADLYAAADLFVFPSTWETFGLAAVEAAMVGLPQLVADLPVLREVLSVHGPQPVVFAKPHDVDEWACAIGQALDKPAPADVVRAFADAICRKYSRQRMIESYLMLLRSHGLSPAAAWPRAEAFS
jgi:glycosyltransferase involved in cell wall biosynthesis